MPNHLHRFHTMPILDGVSRNLHTPYLGDGHGSKTDEMPVWSGDGRGSWANPLFPMYGQKVMQSTSGDGQNGKPVDAATTSDVVLTVNPPPAPAPESPKNGRKSARKDRKSASARTTTSTQSSGMQISAPESDTWKLVALVFVFLVWITTASTLLFLYMDRYLFP